MDGYITVLGIMLAGKGAFQLVVIHQPGDFIQVLCDPGKLRFGLFLLGELDQGEGILHPALQVPLSPDFIAEALDTPADLLSARRVAPNVRFLELRLERGQRGFLATDVKDDLRVRSPEIEGQWPGSSVPQTLSVPSNSPKPVFILSGNWSCGKA